MARTKLNVLRKYLPVSGHRRSDEQSAVLAPEPPQAAAQPPAYSLAEALELVKLEEELYTRLPALDCGCCGSPTCRAFAADVARGDAVAADCIKING